MRLYFYSSTGRTLLKYTARKPCYLQGCTVCLITCICGNRLEKYNLSITGRTHIVSADLTELLHAAGQVLLEGSQRFFNRGECHVLNTINISCISRPLNLCQINIRNNRKRHIGVSIGVISSGGNLYFHPQICSYVFFIYLFI